MVGDERGVRPEERLEPAALPPVDDERLVAPEEPVVDEDHLGADVGGVLEELARARDAAERAGSPRRRRPPAAPAVRTPASARPRAARSRRRRSRPCRPRGQSRGTLPLAEHSGPPSGYPVGARGVAQPGSALRSGRRGPQFESGHPDCSRAGISSVEITGAAAYRRRLTPPGAIASAAHAYARWVLRAVLFDVDFTLSRPGPELGPEAYRRVGDAHGLGLDPARYEDARLAAFEDLRTHPELVHDEEIWIAFTEDIVRGMGGDADGARACAVDMVRRWEIHANFDLYDDAIPVLEALRGPRAADRADLERAARPRGVRAPPRARRRRRGRLEEPRPDEAARLDLRDALASLGVAAAETVMVGDSYADDIEGARALGMRAILLDREGLHPGRARPDRRSRRAARGARLLELARPTSARQAAVCAPSAASRRPTAEHRTRPPPPPVSRRGRRRRPRRRRARATLRAAASRTPPRARQQAPPGRRRTAARRAPAGRSARRPARRTSARERRA